MQTEMMAGEYEALQDYADSVALQLKRFVKEQQDAKSRLAARAGDGTSAGADARVTSLDAFTSATSSTLAAASGAGAGGAATGTATGTTTATDALADAALVSNEFFAKALLEAQEAAALARRKEKEALAIAEGRRAGTAQCSTRYSAD